MYRPPRRSWMFESINVIAWTLGLLVALAVVGILIATAGAAR